MGRTRNNTEPEAERPAKFVWSEGRIAHIELGGKLDYNIDHTSCTSLGHTYYKAQKLWCPCKQRANTQQVLYKKTPCRVAGGNKSQHC